MSITSLEKRIRYIAHKNNRRAHEARLEEMRNPPSILQVVVSRSESAMASESSPSQPVMVVEDAQSDVDPVVWEKDLAPAVPVPSAGGGDLASMAWAAADEETRSLVGFENHGGGLAVLSSFHPIQWATAM